MTITGQNVAIEYRWANNDNNQLSELGDVWLPPGRRYAERFDHPVGAGEQRGGHIDAKRI